MAEAKELTTAAVRKYAPGRRRRRIRDTLAKSLFLIIEPSGHKSFQMRFRRPDGKPAKLTLGHVDFSGRELEGEPQIGQPLTLAAARLLATKVHRERKLGHDPIGDHKAAKHRRRAEVADRAAGTFGACARRFIKEHARPKTRRWRDTARVLGLEYPDDEPIETKGGLAQRWADKDIREIDGHDIFSVVDEARQTAIPGIVARNSGASEARGRALHAALSIMFRWARRRHLVDGNPCASVERPSAPKARDRVLTENEIRWFWQACEAADAPLDPKAPRPYCTALRVLLLTGQRLNEVAGMRHDELHEDDTWHLAGSRTKNHRAHVVPLPPLVRKCIASMPGTVDLIFTTNGSTPISGWSKVKKRVDASMAQRARGTVPPWRIHDLRRTAVTGMAELGIAPHVIEAVVNHISGSKAGVAGTYNRSQLLPERKAALERWSAHIAGLVNGGADNVVALHPRQGGAA